MTTDANSSFIEIQGRRIGKGHPVYIIAEMSCNHGGSFDNAVELIRKAKWAGADAIKLQTYTPETMTINCENDHFKIKGTLWDGKTLYELYETAHTPWEWQPKLKKMAEELNITLFSSAFDSEAVDFLEQVNIPAYKVASFENIDLALLRKVGSTGKPVILSTGMASFVEIAEAVQALCSAGVRQLALLKCVSAYPASPEGMNLRTIPHLADTFHCPIGFSDHTLGSTAAVAAVAVGACIIEKHLVLSHEHATEDAAFSADPDEFRDMVNSIRIAEQALGAVKYGANSQEKENTIFRRSLFTVKEIKAHEKFSEDNIRSIRPGYGLPPRFLKQILGRQAKQDIARGTPLSWEMVGS